MSPSGPDLVQRALDRLGGGPLHTLDLARDVLGLSGHRGAASAAVFALLGPDRRFQVDGDGVWRLDEAASGATALAGLRYAVVDVETTGGSPARGHRVTDIAVIQVEGGRIVDEYRTLVNPGRPIPPYVSRLTGITDDMAVEAPFFEHVADAVRDRLDGRVFVAHNAGFDWRFVRAELARTVGDVPRCRTLCTVRMARGLLPRLRRRNLDALTRHFGVRIHERHRAYGDALATARVFVRLLEEADVQGIRDLEGLRRELRRRARRRRRRKDALAEELELDFDADPEPAPGAAP